MRLRALSIGVVFLIFAAGCGGSDAATPLASPDVEPELVDAGSQDGSPTKSNLATSLVGEREWSAARALAAAHGAEGGFSAMMLAFERGFTVEQIIDGALAVQLGIDGNMFVDGAPAVPGGTRAGIVALPEEDEGEGEGAAARPVDLEITLASFQDVQIERAALFAELVIDAKTIAADLFDAAKDFDITTADPTVAAALILSLASSGYSAQQITDALTQQTVLGLSTIGQENAIAGVEGQCPALYDDSTGALVAPTGYLALDCGQVINSLSQKPRPAADTDSAAPGPPAEPQFASYDSPASAEAIAATERASGGYATFEFEATVDAGVADVRISYTYLNWLRGGKDGGPSGDQNCGLITTVTASGTGPTGSPTSIGLTVESSRIVDFVGALCDDQDTSFYVKNPGDSLGRFDGQLNGLGLSGVYSGVLQTNKIELNAEPA